MGKKIVLLVIGCLFLAMAGCSGHGTKNQPTTTVQATTPLTGLTYIKMVGAQSGWAMDDDSVLRTSDGGATWQDVTPPHIQALLISNTPYGAFFLDANTGWVAGYDQGALTLWRTGDGGRDWDSAKIEISTNSAYLSATSFDWKALDFIDPQNGWLIQSLGVAMGTEPVAICGTVDGGRSWMSVSEAVPGQNALGTLPFGGVKNGLSFADNKHGWITGSWNGNGFWLYRTNDGGKTWNRQDLPVPDGLSTDGGSVETYPPVFYGNGGILPVVFRAGGQTIVFYRTDDRGLTWKATQPLKTSPDNSPLWSIPDSERFFVTDGERSYATGDGGRTWKTILPKSKFGRVRQLDFINDRTGWMLGDGFTLQTRDGGEAWIGVKAVKLLQKYAVSGDSVSIGFHRIAYSDTWHQTANKLPQFWDLYQQNCFVITNSGEGDNIFRAFGLDSLDQQDLVQNNSNGTCFNILTLDRDVVAVRKAPSGDVVVTVRPKEAGYDYVQIGDSSNLPGTQLNDYEKAVTLLFVDDQGNLLARTTSEYFTGSSGAESQ